jgi:choline dehydrogenase
VKDAGSFDYVVVGAGSAGCVLAARLTEDGSKSVLLIEGGGSDRTSLCKVPGMVSIIHTVPQVKKKFDWGYKGAPSQAINGRKIPQVRGKVLGGSSAINGMVYVRGHRSNYDGWEAEGATGWGWDGCLPYLKKLEDWEGGATDTRGAGGPIAVTRPTGISPVSELFEQAVHDVTGCGITDDYNTGDQEGIGRVQLSSKDGLRHSTSERYLHPNLGRSNLTVISGALVDRVQIDGDRATGVVFRKGKDELLAKANHEVLLAGGAVGSPAILLRSGIGPADELKALGIDVAADLPVGRNLHDHLFFPLTFLAPNGGHRGTALHFFGGMIKEKMTGGTWFGRSVFEVFGFLKTKSAGAIPNLQFHSLPWAYPSPNQDNSDVRPTVDTRPAFTIFPTLIYPESRGALTLTSADPEAAPNLAFGYLEAQKDRDLLIEGIQLTREVLAHKTIAAEITDELHPGPSFADEAALRRELPNRVTTVYHPVGTCRMGQDERAVVDPELKVRGIEGLRVIDASVMPNIIGGNTNAPSIMIGEKGADLVRGRTA